MFSCFIEPDLAPVSRILTCIFCGNNGNKHTLTYTGSQGIHFFIPDGFAS